MEQNRAPQFVVEEMSVDDIEPATQMRLASWLETYANDEHGVSRNWIAARNVRQQSSEKQAARRERFLSGKADGTFMGWVARDENGAIVGATTPYISKDGVQHVGSLYVDKNWQGKGPGSALMQKVVDWFDPHKPIELGVVSYNERAKAFYRKWGFEEVPGSEMLLENVVPEIRMVRKGEK